MKKRNFAQRSEEGHIDLPRAREGELFAVFLTGYPSDSHYTTEMMIRKWLQLVNDKENHLFRIKSKKHLQIHLEHWKKTAKEERKIGTIFSLEGAAGIDTELNRLYIYHDLGLRSMGVTWNETNQFATGVPGDPDRGFTREGLDLLSAMEDLGIIIDVSHLNDKSFWNLIDHTNSPIIASHSNLRSFSKHKRNLTREMAEAIINTGGSIGVNFCTAFLQDDPDTATRDAVFEVIGELIKLGGPENVHIGSDFDGCQTPEEIKDVSTMPGFFSELQKKLELTSEDLDKIKHGNMIRIMKQVW